ncbi:MAG: hypothetical protein KVP17_000217 [Porospora cf. gigantea B]|uniref:uncharacterized protein n=1 Tax=Porospora cf. gigantea B TaxID=2853592 RepID=UPI0035719A0B|nr:MAG: hypothetical protein KVP17_000217 [Porospora cf. gigantea B]
MGYGCACTLCRFHRHLQRPGTTNRKTSLAVAAHTFQFRRLLDIGEILTVDSVETLSDSLSASRDWRLSREEFRQLLTMRVDLDQDSISRFFNERHFIAGLQ